MQGKTFFKKFSPAPLSKTFTQKGKKKSCCTQTDILSQTSFLHKPSICHPERSRTFSERRAREKREVFMTRGISLQISVACLLKVTFTVESHRNTLRDPIVAFAPRFCSVYHSAKLRLRSAVGHASLRSG